MVCNIFFFFPKYLFTRVECRLHFDHMNGLFIYNRDMVTHREKKIYNRRSVEPTTRAHLFEPDRFKGG